MTILIFLAILSLLILVHEGGHFWAAKKAGIKVEEFGFGLPPRLWGKKVGETIYSINALPFGGFVRLYGEESRVRKEKHRAFFSQNRKVKIKVLLAGVAMNFLLGTVAFALVYSFWGIPQKSHRVKVLKVEDDSPADKAGLKEGDILLMVEDEIIESNQQFVEAINKRKGKKTIISLERAEENPCQTNSFWRGEENEGNYLFCDQGELKAVLFPRVNPPAHQGALGVTISDTEIKFYPFYQMIPRAIYSGLEETFFWTREMIASLKGIGQRLLRGESLASLGIAGPVGIYQVTGQVAKSGGFWALVQFVGILSINLAVFNLLPFPALDGGRVIFVFLEKFIGVKKREKIEAAANMVGMGLLLFFIFLVTVGDIRRIRGN